MGGPASIKRHTGVESVGNVSPVSSDPSIQPSRMLPENSKLLLARQIEVSISPTYQVPTVDFSAAADSEHAFPVALDPIKVPKGCFPIEVVQFWRGEFKRGSPLPLHWAIVVRTSASRGNCHEIVGDMNTFATQDRFDIPLLHDEDWRGSHIVGYVSPARMDDLSNHIALVPVVRRRWSWNCQNWVYDVLEGLRDPGGMYVDEKLTFGKLQAQMMYLLEAWERADI